MKIKTYRRAAETRREEFITTSILNNSILVNVISYISPLRPPPNEDAESFCLFLLMCKICLKVKLQSSN